MISSLICTLLLLVTQADLKPTEALVTELEGQGKFDQYGVYSGYVDLDANADKSIYYLLVEAVSWETAPLVIWINGGPGCSSLIGWGTENGPYLIADGDTGFEASDYSWNKEANILYVDQPAGIGFSTCNNTASSTGPGDICDFNDNNTAQDGLVFLQKWYDLFPEYKGHELYMSGESYAGVYIPLWALAVHNYNQNSPDFHIPLNGTLVGNGCTNWAFDCMPATIDIAYQRAVISEDMYNSVIEAGCSNNDDEIYQNRSAECTAMQDSVMASVTQWQYDNLYLHPATADAASAQCAAQVDLEAGSAPWKQPYAKMKNRSEKCGTGGYGDSLSLLTAYLNGDLVQQQLNIRNNSQPWAVCNENPKWRYKEYAIASQYAYEELHKAGSDIRMLFYSGDKDANVPTIGSVNWIGQLNRTEVEAWRPYFVDDQDVNKQVAGYFWRMEGLDFATVHGAGHLVPTNQPEIAKHLLFNWINKTKI